MLHVAKISICFSKVTKAPNSSQKRFRSHAVFQAHLEMDSAGHLEVLCRLEAEFAAGLCCAISMPQISASCPRQPI
jgi:hypothetical protein